MNLFTLNLVGEKVGSSLECTDAEDYFLGYIKVLRGRRNNTTNYITFTSKKTMLKYIFSVLFDLGSVEKDSLFISHFPVFQTAEITTQKIYYLQYCLANRLSIFLASSYILN